MPGSFFDTNVLIYIASNDPMKADQAEAIVGSGGAISVQVLNELANVARRKMRMSWQDTHAFLSLLRGLLTVHSVAVETQPQLSAAKRDVFRGRIAGDQAPQRHIGVQRSNGQPGTQRPIRGLR